VMNARGFIDSSRVPKEEEFSGEQIPQRPGRKMNEFMYDRLTAIVFNEVEAAAFSKAALKREEKPGVPIGERTPRLVNAQEAIRSITDMHAGLGVAVVTRGEQPALMRFQNTEATMEIPVLPADNPQRSTSLGDAFVASFGAYLAASEGPDWHHSHGFDGVNAQRIARNAALFGSAMASLLTDTNDRSVFNTEAWKAAAVLAAKNGYVLEAPRDVSDGTNEQFVDVTARNKYAELQFGDRTPQQRAMLAAIEHFDDSPHRRAAQIEAYEAVMGDLYFGRTLDERSSFFSAEARELAQATRDRIGDRELKPEAIVEIVVQASRLGDGDTGRSAQRPLDRGEPEPGTNHIEL